MHHSITGKGNEHQTMGQDMAGGSREVTGHGHHNHHSHMVADFKKRFWVSLFITIPVLILSPLIQELLGVEVLSLGGSL
jgi:Cu2+-exporting ATPase